MNDSRRAFLKALAGRSLAAAGVTAATVALVKNQPDVNRAWRYAKPRIKSFVPDSTLHAYAAPTGGGTFSLKGNSVAFV